MATYSIDLGFDTLEFSVDLAQASSPIRYYDSEGESHSTPYQCADARHDADQAVRLVVEYLGREYYAQPGDKRSNDEILDELLADCTVEAKEDEDDV